MIRRRATAAGAVLLILLAGCGTPPDRSEGFDGSPDCEVETWAFTMQYERDHEGKLTPYDAMVEWSSVYENREHRIHVESSRTATVVVEGMEVAFMRVIELPTETFEVVEARGCSGFEPPGS